MPYVYTCVTIEEVWSYLNSIKLKFHISVMCIKNVEEILNCKKYL